MSHFTSGSCNPQNVFTPKIKKGPRGTLSTKQGAHLAICFCSFRQWTATQKVNTNDYDSIDNGDGENDDDENNPED